MPDDTHPHAPQDIDRVSYVRTLVAHRCPELSEADLAMSAEPDQGDTLPSSIGAQIVEILDHMMTRMDRIEKAVMA